jgi:hypothetical protein
MLNDDPPIPPGPQLRKNISAFLGWVVIVVLGIVGLAIVIAAVILVGTALGAVPPMTIVILLLYIIAFRGKE